MSSINSVHLQFVESISPPGTYFRLKLAILLSLVSQQPLSDEDQLSASGRSLHILVVSKDILQIQRLFLFSKSFTPRSVVFSHCNDLCYSISKDPTNLGSCMIHSKYSSYLDQHYVTRHRVTETQRLITHVHAH